MGGNQRIKNKLTESECDLLLKVGQSYLDNAQNFVSYDELMDLKIRLESIFEKVGVERR